jgi:hypothetical protein
VSIEIGFDNQNRAMDLQESVLYVMTTGYLKAILSSILEFQASTITDEWAPSQLLGLGDATQS